jgi:hypothetical protein
VTAKVATTRRGSNQKRSSDEGEASTDVKPESNQGKVATLAGPLVPKSDGSRSSTTLFEIHEDSDPDFYSLR